MSEELKPCPFCGKSRPENWTEVNKLVLCPYCETVALRRTWNRRPIEDTQAIRIAELEAERDRMREALVKLVWLYSDEYSEKRNNGLRIDGFYSHEWLDMILNMAREALKGIGK